jgi:integrase
MSAVDRDEFPGEAESLDPGSAAQVDMMPIDSVNIGERHREHLGDIPGLAASIQEVGLLHPIVVTADHRLIAGRRRLEAYRTLGRRDTNGDRPVSGFSKAKAHLDRLSGTEKWRFHDIRRTVRTHLAALGVPESVAGRILNHRTNTLARVYDRHEYADEKREALVAWCDRLDAIVTD